MHGRFPAAIRPDLIQVPNVHHERALDRAEREDGASPDQVKKAYETYNMLMENKNFGKGYWMDEEVVAMGALGIQATLQRLLKRRAANLAASSPAAQEKTRACPSIFTGAGDREQ